MTREGSRFAAYLSSDGESWNQTGGAQTVTMSSSATIGLFVTSFWNGFLVTAAFDHVEVASAEPPSIAGG